MARTLDATNHPVLIAAPAQFNARALNALDQQIDDVISQHAPLLDLDMSAVELLDSTALNWLLTAQTRLTACEIAVRLIRVGALVEDILVATRLDTRFTLQLTPEGERHG